MIKELNMKKILALLLIGCFCCPVLYSQGLSPAFINQFTQDPNGSNSDCGPASLAMCLHAIGLRVKGATASSSVLDILMYARKEMYWGVDSTKDGVDSTGTKRDDPEHSAYTGLIALVNAGKASGADSSSTGASIANLDSALANNCACILGGNVASPGTWGAKSGATAHWVCVVGKNSDGTYVLGDPCYQSMINVTDAQINAFWGSSGNLMTFKNNGGGPINAPNPGVTGGGNNPPATGNNPPATGNNPPTGGNNPPAGKNTAKNTPPALNPTPSPAAQLLAIPVTTGPVDELGVGEGAREADKDYTDVKISYVMAQDEPQCDAPGAPHTKMEVHIFNPDGSEELFNGMPLLIWERAGSVFNYPAYFKGQVEQRSMTTKNQKDWNAQRMDQTFSIKQGQRVVYSITGNPEQIGTLKFDLPVSGTPNDPNPSSASSTSTQQMGSLGNIITNNSGGQSGQGGTAGTSTYKPNNVIGKPGDSNGVKQVFVGGMGYSPTLYPAVEQWRPIVEKYFEPDKVDMALAIITRESKGSPTAVNPTSGCAGLFQHHPTYWDGRADAIGCKGAPATDPEVNIAAAALIAKKGQTWTPWGF